MQSYSEPIEAGGHSASQLPFATQQEAIDKLKVTYNSFVIILLKMKNLLSRIVRYHSPPIPMSYTSFEKAFIRSTKNKPQMVVKKKKKQFVRILNRWNFIVIIFFSWDTIQQNASCAIYPFLPKFTQSFQNVSESSSHNFTVAETKRQYETKLYNSTNFHWFKE